MPHAAHRRFPLLAPPIMMALILTLAGCASSYKVEVNSLTDPELPTGTTYVLTTRDPQLPEKDLNYYEISDRVRTALAAHGMYEAAVPADADIVVEIDYGERAPKTKVENIQQTHIMPPDPLGREIDPITGRPYPPGISIGGNPGTYPYPSRRTQTVTTNSQRITQVSEKYIRLTARENLDPRDRARKKPAQVWVVEAVIEDEDSDVYTCMPPMVNALTNYIGQSSGGRQTVVVSGEQL